MGCLMLRFAIVQVRAIQYDSLILRGIVEACSSAHSARVTRTYSPFRTKKKKSDANKKSNRYQVKNCPRWDLIIV